MDPTVVAVSFPLAPESNSATLQSPSRTLSIKCLLMKPHVSPRVSGMSSRVRCLASSETSRTRRRSLERSSEGGRPSPLAAGASASTRAGVPAAALVLPAFPLSVASCSATLRCLAKSLATCEVEEARGSEEMTARQLLAEGDRARSSGAEAAAAAGPEEGDADPPLGGLHLVSSAARFGSAAASRSSREGEEPPPPEDEGGDGNGTTLVSSSPTSSAAESFSVSSADDHSHAACSSAGAVAIVAAASRDAAKAAADFLGGRCCCGEGGGARERAVRERERAVERK